MDMRYRFNPFARHATGTAIPLRYRVAAFWVVIALLCLPTGWVVASVVDKTVLGAAGSMLVAASVVVLINVVLSGDTDLGDYVHGENETLFLAGQHPRSRTSD